MGKPVDLTGQVFHYLTAIESVGRSKCRERLWLCLCKCGNTHIIPASSLRAGKTKSCGCYQKEQMRKFLSTHGESLNGQASPELSVWYGMKRRCLNKDDKSYENYGGRGIKICDRWLESFDNFLIDMGRRPSDLHSLDRIDNDGNYEPNNCRWATRTVQSINKRIPRSNKSGSKGVQQLKTGKWRARIGLGGQRLSLGCYETKEEATKARKEGELKYYGTTE